jgi:hypothetical protein
LFSKDAPFTLQKGPSVYDCPQAFLKIGKIVPVCTKIENYPPLENDGKPILTLTKMCHLGDKKGAFARKDLLGGLGDYDFAQSLLNHGGLKTLDNARMKVAGDKSIEAKEKIRIIGDLEAVEKALFHFLPDKHKESAIFLKDVKTDDWIEKLKARIQKADLHQASEEDNIRAAMQLQEDLDYFNTIVQGSTDRAIFLKHDMQNVILSKVQELASYGPSEILKNGAVAQAIGELNETLYNLLKDPIMLKTAMQKNSGLKIEKACLKATLEAARKMRYDPDASKLRGKLIEGPQYTLGPDHCDKATEATLLVLSLMCPNKTVCKENGLGFLPFGTELGELPSSVNENRGRLDIIGEGPKTLFGNLRDVLLAKADRPLGVFLSSQILGDMFEAVPHEEFRGKNTLLDTMLKEAVADVYCQPGNVPLREYRDKIQKKLRQLDVDEMPKLFDLIGNFLAKKVKDLDPLFGHEEDLLRWDYLAAWFKKLVDMAQKAPLDEIHSNCLNRILQAIEGNPKGPKDHFLMMNLDMHKTGILGGMTPKLTKEQMQRC